MSNPQRTYPVTPCNTTMTSQHTDGTVSFSSWPTYTSTIRWSIDVMQHHSDVTDVTLYLSARGQKGTPKNADPLTSYSTIMTSLTFQWRHCTYQQHVQRQDADPLTSCSTTMTSLTFHWRHSVPFSSWTNMFIDKTLIQWRRAAPQWRH